MWALTMPSEIRDGVDLDSFRLQETYSGSIELEKEQGVIPGFGDGSLYNTEDEKDLLSHIITVLNETHGMNLTENDKVDMQHIYTSLEADEGLQAVLNADNPRDAKVYKFNQVLDWLLEFGNTKLDLYKKLTEPKVNEMLKRQWFEVLASGMGDQNAIQINRLTGMER
jgi:type I restriction enzyme, R subunit